MGALHEKQIRTIRDDYDRLAADYTAHVADELQHKPLDCKLLRRFAAGVRGPLCDMGCGPGHVTRFLKDAGADVFGLDLSPNMLDQARKLNPGIRFQEGNMLALDLEDGSLGGISAFYAIVNLPKDALPVVFRQMARVLMPGGRLLVAFHAGDEVLRNNELWGHSLKIDFLFFQPLEIKRQLEQAGLVVDEIIERDPYPDVEYPSHRAYLFVHKPEGIHARQP